MRPDVAARVAAAAAAVQAPSGNHRARASRMWNNKLEGEGAKCP